MSWSGKSRILIVAACDGFYTLQPHDAGYVLVEVQDALPPPPVLRVVTTVRATLPLDNRGGAVLADALIETHPVPELSIRAGASSGLGGGDLGGVGAGLVWLTVGLELDMLGLGVGAGATTIASPLGGSASTEAAALVAHARIGRRSMTHFEAQLACTFVDAVELVSVGGLLRIPGRHVDFLARGVGGHHGVALGELGFVLWLVREQARPVLGLDVHGGGGGVFYQPRCRWDGDGCGGTRWYAGPHLGVGLEWHP